MASCSESTSMLAIIKYFALPGIFCPPTKVQLCSSGLHAQEARDIRSRRFDFNDDRFVDTFDTVRHALGMPANIARAENVGFFPDGHFNLALDDVSQGFVLVHVQGSPHSRRIVDFQESHLVALYEWLYQQIT